MTPQPPEYICGHSAHELERLEIQAAFFEDLTRAFLLRAGLARGMRVLDIGCGAGDVSFLAAEIVAPSGHVVGVDRAAEAVALAARRAAAPGLAQVSFRATDIASLPADLTVDALIGRFVLMHQPDPARTLRQAARSLRPGGLVALIESHLSASVAGLHSLPHSPLYDRVCRWFAEVIRASGAHPDMGLRLRSTFLDAGLPPPQVRLEARVEGGPGSPVYRYIAESVRSMLPLARSLGIDKFSASEIDNLEEQLRKETTVSNGVLTSPVLVSAHCRVG
ncbi:MAG TPA: class I SAM-dependent methyltransferase [Bryobacteraceae bacterium]|nr:class I SAM-dependent methyltransferase [Bryobacteraceae bacterium]